MKNRFFKYVSQNILAMIGLSLYILADTYFISKAVGANGITALNMALPVYGVIFALGQMVGVGSAIRYSIVKEQYRNSNKDGSNVEVNIKCKGFLKIFIFLIFFYFSN